MPEARVIVGALGAMDQDMSTRWRDDLRLDGAHTAPRVTATRRAVEGQGHR